MIIFCDWSDNLSGNVHIWILGSLLSPNFSIVHKTGRWFLSCIGYPGDPWDVYIIKQIYNFTTKLWTLNIYNNHINKCDQQIGILAT